MEMLTIGQLARAAAVNVQTVRYYERRGLLAPAARRRSGYREFVGSDVRRIRFIKNAQGLGFSLEEIGELLSLRVADTKVCDEVRERAQSKIQEIGAKVADLERMVQALDGLVQSCEARTATEECPILRAFSED